MDLSLSLSSTPSPVDWVNSQNKRVGVADAFEALAVRRSVELDLSLIDVYDPLLRDLERELVATAKVHDPTSFQLLRSIPGVGKILGSQCGIALR